MAAKRANALEKEERIDFCVQLLMRRVTFGEFKRAVKARYGLKKTQAAKYHKWAREAIIEASHKTREEHRAMALASFESVLRNPESTTREKMDAQAHIVELLGLKIKDPTEHVISGGDRPIAIGVLGQIAKVHNDPTAIHHAQRLALSLAKGAGAGNTATDAPLGDTGKVQATPAPPQD